MFKPEELLPRETWTFVLSKLSTKDELSCRCICVSFKKEVESILNKNQDRLWLRRCDDDYEHYFCYDTNHRISSRDTLYFDGTISIKNLMFVSALMPSLKILHLDPLYQAYLEGYDDHWYPQRRYNRWHEEFPDYRDKEGRAVPITKIFPQVTCLILPGETEQDNFVGDLSQVKHLTVLYGVEEESTMFPNLHSLEARYWDGYLERIPNTPVSMPSTRFVVPHVRIEWRTLPKTLEVIETELNCNEYISIGKPHFSNLKILKGLSVGRYEEYNNLEPLNNFLKDHKASLTELSFSIEEEVANIKVLLPLLTRLQKLSVRITNDKQAIELKEIKALSHNLQYFELSFSLRYTNEKRLGPILENLPLGLDNLSIEYARSYGEISTFIEKIIEKVVNGDTKRVTIAVVDVGIYTRDMIEKIVKVSPSLVRVGETNERVFEYRSDSPGGRTEHFRFICDIVISL